MPERELLINDPIGIHSRPAGVFAKKAKGFQARVEMSFKDKTVNAKSMLALMSLGVKSQQTVRLSAEGEDAGAALDALEELARTEFGGVEA